MANPVKPVTCPYCSKPAEKVTGLSVYPHRSDLQAKIFWRCSGKCAAWVGCHPGTSVPMGRLANDELRLWKRKAHAAFDPLWRVCAHNKKKKGSARGRAYQALADILGIPVQDCHIGEFDEALCQRTIAAIPQLRRQLATT